MLYKLMHIHLTGSRRAVYWSWVWSKCKEKSEVPKHYQGCWPSNWDQVRKKSP